ncbi:hypothetical protein V2G26_008941 [Clonostachys chloroleuca]|uniref:NDT80 domain-containing protein n=1 Tax=Clonostachys chloroleuca TaxID=1926264 RepID=A0AA35Q9Z8_9HYPO|nr:unnamed protein product [Clonostachys chloroleuca]
MAAFNSMPTGDGLHGLSHGPTGQLEQSLPRFEQDINFEDPLLDGSAFGQLPFTPSYDFDGLTATFEDPFSYSTRPFEAPSTHQDNLNDGSSPQELDNKLLGFSDPITATTLVDEMGNVCDVGMTAELYGMFFVAEDVFGADTTGRPLELTCYRRNLWQCTGQITLPRMASVVDDQGRHLPLVELSASITAMESIEKKATEIISIPWKSSNPQASEEPKTAGPPSHITLDSSTGHEVDANRTTISVAWKRLQFKHATANNGRRKGLQQHYVVQINLVGRTKAGDTIKIAEIRSGPVIVRGRSPRNFDSRKDVPLTGDRKFERRNTSGSTDHPTIKSERENLLCQTFQTNIPANFIDTGSYPMQTSQTPSDQGSEWATPQAYTQPGQGPHPSKRQAISPTMAKPPVPGWTNDAQLAKSNTNPSSKGVPRQMPSAPINLSLSEDERSPNRSSAEISSPRGKTQQISGLVSGSSPPEEGDPLYEYFPLSVDDWMPPVDAVYRPHVVHHTVVPPEIKAQQIRRKAKRYFAAD